MPIPEQTNQTNTNYVSFPALTEKSVPKNPHESLKTEQFLALAQLNSMICQMKMC